MSTTAPTRRTDLARRWVIDINTVADPGTGYERLLGVEDFKPVHPEFRIVSDETNADLGAMREDVTGYSWRHEIKLKLSLNLDGTSRNSVHQFLRNKYLAMRTGSAAANEFGVRWYDVNGISAEAHEGRVFVKAWPHDGGKDQDIVSIVLQGQGAFTDITNPAASQLPVVTSLGSSGGGTAGGDLVLIYGNHFTGTTTVEFGATAATEYAIISDSLISAVAPAHAGGSVQVKVTNAAGVSANTAADDYLYA